MENDPLIDLLRSDGSIIINKRLARKIGMNETIIYSELLSRYNYFRNKGQLTEDGFFFNLVSDLEEAVCLGEKGQRTAIKHLAELGLLEVDYRDMPPKRYFKIHLNLSRLLEIMN